MMRQLGAYWIRLARYDYNNNKTITATYVLLAYDVDEAARIALLSDGNDARTDRAGVFDLRRLDDHHCPDHPDQVVDIIPCGELISWYASDNTAHYSPGAFRGWCAAGAHVIRLPWQENTDEAVKAALVGWEQRS